MPYGMKKFLTVVACFILLIANGAMSQNPIVDSLIKEGNEQYLKSLETKEDISELKLKIADTNTDIIRWVFAFFIPLLLAKIGLYVRK